MLRTELLERRIIMIKAVLGLVLCLNSVKCGNLQLEPFIVNGEFSKIEDFPHSVCLAIDCDITSMCGASVLNQRVLLTAAHCRGNCSVSPRISAFYGNSYLPNAMMMIASTFQIHENYVEKTQFTDIGLVKLPQSLCFGDNVRRVAILPTHNAPYDEVAAVDGWGLIDEIEEIPTDRLKDISQKTIERHHCEEMTGHNIPPGVFCAVGDNEHSYVSGGDSGSALVIRSYIQIGIVSYKLRHVRFIGMYTDVGYYYDWIKENALKLFCSPFEET